MYAWVGLTLAVIGIMRAVLSEKYHNKYLDTIILFLGIIVIDISAYVLNLNYIFKIIVGLTSVLLGISEGIRMKKRDTRLSLCIYIVLIINGIVIMIL